MPPEQPYYQPNPQPQASYDFITNSAKPPRKPLLPGNSPAQRILFGLAGATIILIVIVVVANVAFSGNGNSDKLVKLAQQQGEVARISAIASKSASAQSTKNVATSIQLSTASDQQKIVAYLQQHGTKLKAKQLALGHSAQTDQALSAAASSGTFDETYNTIIKQNLANYRQSLQQTYNASQNSALRQILSQEYANSQLLLEQLKLPG